MPPSAPILGQGRLVLLRAWPSVLRIILWGRVLLVGQMLVPMFFVGKIIFEAGNYQGGTVLLLCCSLFILWNLYFLEETLRAVPAADGESPVLPRSRKFLIFAGQLAFAITCHYLGRAGSIEGSKQYFWMPLPIFVPLLTHQARSLVVGGGLPIVVATVLEWVLDGGLSAFIWAVAHCCVTGFIIISLLSVREFGKMGRTMGGLANELEAANHVLESQSHHAVQLAIAAERNRLARDIHDALGHSLTVVSAQLEAASALLPKDVERAQLAIEKAQTASQNGMEEVRRSVRSLRVRALEDQDLLEALQILVATYERPSMSITLSVLGELPPLSGKQEEGLFRCAQEALTNATRHAQADHIALELDFSQAKFARLQVKDNGCGMTPDTVEGNGIRGLRERALLLQGTLIYSTANEGGTCCHIQFPLS
jgi:signal transduction histidine kinase